MANWKYRVDLNHLRKGYEDENDIPKLRDGVVTELKKLSETIKEKEYKTELQEIIEEFEDINASEDEFNSVLSSLYDWGDQETEISVSIVKNRLCWIGFAF